MDSICACSACGKRLKSRQIYAINYFSSCQHPDNIKEGWSGYVEDMHPRGKCTTYLCEEHYKKAWDYVLKLSRTNSNE